MDRCARTMVGDREGWCILMLSKSVGTILLPMAGTLWWCHHGDALPRDRIVLSLVEVDASQLTGAF
eukprot:9470750-Pyramimonas_sp.AAC.1